MTTLANARSAPERPKPPRLLTIAKAVGVVVALAYVGYAAFILNWMRGYQIAWSLATVLTWVVPPVAAVLTLAWPRAGGVAFLLVAALELYQQIGGYASSQGEVWQLSVGEFLAAIAMVVGPALFAGAFLLIAGRQRAPVTEATAAAPSGPGAR